ncbi:MAG: hypothetical protein ACOWWR_03560 [Eubacteriales bacterium]
MKKLVCFILILCCIASPKVKGQEVLYDQFKTDLGITINSYTENWTGEKLVQVYNELLENAHGNEIKYLKEINLYKDNPSGGNEEGVYNGVYKKISILGKTKVVLTKDCSINLYNLSDKKTVDDFAKTLSHEYGHHFTLFYLIKFENKTFEDFKTTKLFKARKLQEYSKVTNDYTNGHEWSIIEICAEDYVQLYGSPNAKKIVDFKDINERYQDENINETIRYDYGIYNLNPQENNWIPLVLEVEGLKEYWENASGIQSTILQSTKPQIALVKINDLGYNKFQYVFRWTKSENQLGNEADYYTLITSDLQKEIITPIHTVSKEEELQGIVGSIKMDTGNRIMYYTDSFLEKEMLFKVYAIYHQGGVISSQELKVNFSEPQVNQIQEGIEELKLPDEAGYNQEEELSIFDKMFNYIIEKIIQLLYEE